MDFAKIVPLTAAWIRTGKFYVFGPSGKIVAGEHGLLARIDRKIPIYMPVSADADVKEGDTFSSYKIVQLRKFCYSKDEYGNLNQVPAKNEAGEPIFRWVVSEIFK